MVKQNQFIGKASYVEPSVRSVVLQARDVILQGSYDGTFHTEKLNYDEEEDL